MSKGKEKGRNHLIIEEEDELKFKNSFLKKSIV